MEEGYIYHHVYNWCTGWLKNSSALSKMYYSSHHDEHWCPVVAEMRKTFKLQILEKIKGSSSIQCTLDVHMILSYSVIHFWMSSVLFK